MNLEKWSFGVALAATAFAVAGLAACERRNDVPPAPMGASPSAQVIGTVPAPPSGDPPGTTAVLKSPSMAKQANSAPPADERK